MIAPYRVCCVVLGSGSCSVRGCPISGWNQRSGKACVWSACAGVWQWVDKAGRDAIFRAPSCVFVPVPNPKFADRGAGRLDRIASLSHQQHAAGRAQSRSLHAPWVCVECVFTLFLSVFHSERDTCNIVNCAIVHYLEHIPFLRVFLRLQDNDCHVSHYHCLSSLNPWCL